MRQLYVWDSSRNVHDVKHHLCTGMNSNSRSIKITPKRLSRLPCNMNGLHEALLQGTTNSLFRIPPDEMNPMELNRRLTVWIKLNSTRTHSWYSSTRSLYPHQSDKGSHSLRHRRASHRPQRQPSEIFPCEGHQCLRMLMR